MRLRNDATYFATVLFTADYRDRITSVNTGAVTPSGRDVTQSVNAAASDVWGFETEFSLTLSEAWRLHGDLAYIYGEQRIAGAASEPADRIPPLQGSLRVEYEATPTVLASAWVRFADRQNRLSSRDVRDVRINPAGTPGWSMLGARVTWEPNTEWQLSATLENLFDTGYRLHGSGIDATGRNLIVAVRRSWQ